MNIFSWSMPFVAEKVAEIFISILNKNNLDEEDTKVKVPDIKKNENLSKLKKNKGRMRNKLVFMSKILKM